MNELLDAALKYAGYGWRVHPCKKDKTPHLNKWQEKATKDPEQIKRWWSEHPDASIGCACGPESGIWVLDIDLPDGPESLNKIISRHGRLPETLEQKTGSGGRQIFFQCNGTEIRNTANKAGKNLDSRGNGGYIILPPSPHPSGGAYEWTTKKKPAEAPAWLVGLIKTEPEAVTIPDTNSTEIYAQKALAGEIMNVSMAGKGCRNDTLNKAAFALGQLIAGGVLNASQAQAGLLGAALSIGLKQAEAKNTIKSGFKSGAAQPRKPEPDIVYDTSSQQSQQSQQSHIESANGALVSTSQQRGAEGAPPNLAALILEFINNSTGSFTTRDIDHEFGIKTRAEKNARSRALYRYGKLSYINKDKSISGKYHIVKQDVEWIDLNAPAEESFPIILPFEIHKRVVIPPKAIVLLAGSSNAGKTAFCLNTMYLNRGQKYQKLYMMSEMGQGEYIGRIKKFSPHWKDEWKQIKAASLSYNFEDVIKLHNPDGLSCIDYLEEKDGEYFKITSSIRSVYDNLGDGVALVAIQKGSKATIGRGGEGTLEKARLYMTMDYLATGESSIICTLKLAKVKNFIGQNLQGYEIHFRLSEGHRIEPLTNWMVSSKVDRDAYIRKYEKLIDDIPDVTTPGDVWMKLVDGKTKRITEKTARGWQKEFFAVDVFRELERIAADNLERPFLNDKYFFQLSAILKKKQKEEEAKYADNNFTG